LYRASGQYQRPGYYQQNNQYQYRQPHLHYQAYPPQQVNQAQSLQQTFTPQQQYQQPRPQGHVQTRVRREPLPFSQAELFKQCVAEGMLAPIPTRQFLPPYPHWYDTNLNCDFHNGVQGHSTENCYVLRDKLYELIDGGKLKLTNLEATQATTSKNTASTSTATEGIHMIEEWLDQDDCDEINIL
jgi:hypothetical protein